MFAKALVLSVAMLFTASLASAVVIDGVNDFPPGSLIDADGGDTEFAPLDIGNVYVTYDATNLYIGYDYDQDGWTGCQVGIAVAVGTAGGTTDPWCHQIAFLGLCKPAYVAYIDVDSNWNEWRVWDGANWVQNPNVLSWSDDTAFDEVAIPYSLMGIDCTVFSQVFFEIWVTQNGCSKGPLDLSYGDPLQLSTPSGTVWDIETPVNITCYWCLDLFSPSGTEETTWGNIKALYK
jgi:hypothetical protein